MSTRDSEQVVELLPFARAEAEAEPRRWEQVLQTLLLDSASVLALELVGEGRAHRLLVRVSSDAAQLQLMSQLQAVWPQLRLRPVAPEDDPLRLRSPAEGVSGLRVRLSGQVQRDAIPPPGYAQRGSLHRAEADPIHSLLAALPRAPGCRLVAQLVLAPAGSRWLRRQRRRIEQLRRERAADPSRHGGMTFLVVLALSLLGLAVWSAPSRLLTVGTGLQPGLLAALGVMALLLLFQSWVSWQRRKELDLLWLDQEPLRQQAFRVQLRLLAINSLPEDPSPGSPQGGWRRWWWRWQQAHQAAVQRRAALARLLAAYRQFEWLGARVWSHRLPPWQVRRLLQPGGWRGPRLRWYAWDLLPVSTVGALWHVPAQLRAEISPLLTRHSSRILPVPPSLASRPGQPVARAFLGQESVAVPWPSELLTGHLLAVGRSGEGKSTALLQVALEALRQERRWGLVVIDPHDLVDQLLPLIPPDRGGDVVLMDLSDPEHVPGINPLDVHVAPNRDKAVADLLACFREIWATSWGPRMEAACEAALKLIYSVNQQLVTEGDERQLTLLEVLPILCSDRVRNRLLRLLRRPDPFLIRWWASYFEPLSTWMRLERIDPVLTKFAKFEQVSARRVLGQSRSTVDLRACLEGRILLVKLASSVGEDVARLVGATLLNLLGLFFQEQPPGQTPTLVIVDEFQWFLGVRWRMLAELRKFGAHFALATQSLAFFRQEAQERKVLAQILANVQTILAFAGSADDAQTLAPELGGITAEDLQSLPRHHCYARLPIAGERITCSLQVLLPEVADPTIAEYLRATSRERFCRPAQEIDRELAERQQWLLLGAEGTRVARAPSGAEDAVAGEPAQEPEGDAAGGTLVRDSLAAGEGPEETPAPSYPRGSKRGRKGLRKRTESGSFRPIHRQGQVHPFLLEAFEGALAEIARGPGEAPEEPEGAADGS